MALRTRSTPSAEIESNPSRVIPDNSQTLVVEETQPSNDIDTNLVAIQARIAKLEKLKELREKEAILQAKITELTPDKERPTRRRNYNDDSNHEREIKFKNVTTFSLDFTLQKRQEWLLNL